MPTVDCNSFANARKVNSCKLVPGGVGLSIAIWTGGTGAISFSGDANDLIVDIENSATTTFYHIAARPENCDYVVTNPNDDPEIGGYDSTITITLKKNEYKLRKLTQDLANSQTFVLFHANNGTYRLFGEEFGCFATENGGSGRSRSDKDEVTLTFRSYSTYAPRYMNSTWAGYLPDYDSVL